MPSKSTKSKASGSSGSSHRKANPFPEMKPMPRVPVSKKPDYLVVDATLPSHVFCDRSLFTTYIPLRRLHRTVFGPDIVIEGTGDVHVRVVVNSTSILFCFRDSWHVPSSPHHLLSCSTIISLGHQVMIAGRSPRMIFSHKRRLAEPRLPKYIPFTRLNGFISLKFDISFLSPESPQHTSAMIQPTTQPVLSLQASCHNRPFAGFAFHHSLLPPPPPSESESSALATRTIDFKRKPEATLALAANFNTLLDSGCVHHIIRDRSLFSNFISKTTSVGTANFGFLEALGSGDVAFRYPYGDHHVTFTLRGCLFAPTAPINLLSVGVLVERRGMPCLLSPAGITKAFFPSDNPKLPGLVFLPNVTNRMPFLTLVFVSPAPSCPISSPTIPADPSTPSHLSHVSTTASEAHDHLIPPSRLPDFCTAEAAEHLDGAVMSVDVAGIGVVVDVLNGGAEDLYVDVVLNGGVDTLPAAVSEDVMVAVVLKGVENQAANKCVGDTFNRVTTATGSDSSSSSTLTSPASSLDFPDLDDSIIFHSSTRSYIHHHFPCVLPFNLSSIPNATSKSACFSSSPSSFSYNNSLFRLSPPLPTGTLTLYESSFTVSVRQLPMHAPFSPQILCRYS